MRKGSRGEITVLITMAVLLVLGGIGLLSSLAQKEKKIVSSRAVVTPYPSYTHSLYGKLKNNGNVSIGGATNAVEGKCVIDSDATFLRMKSDGNLYPDKNCRFSDFVQKDQQFMIMAVRTDPNACPNCSDMQIADLLNTVPSNTPTPPTPKPLETPLPIQSPPPIPAGEKGGKCLAIWNYYGQTVTYGCKNSSLVCYPLGSTGVCVTPTPVPLSTSVPLSIPIQTIVTLFDFINTTSGELGKESCIYRLGLETRRIECNTEGSNNNTIYVYYETNKGWKRYYKQTAVCQQNNINCQIKILDKQGVWVKKPSSIFQYSLFSINQPFKVKLTIKNLNLITPAKASLTISGSNILTIDKNILGKIIGSNEQKISIEENFAINDSDNIVSIEVTIIDNYNKTFTNKKIINNGAGYKIPKLKTTEPLTIDITRTDNK